MRKFRHVPKMPGHRISPWRQLLCSLLIGLLLALAVIVWINLQLRPMVLAVSDAHFSNEMSLIISRALDEADDTLPSYSDLAELHYDESGMLAAVTTNMEAGNLLRSRLVTDLLPGLSAMEEETVAIPAGSLTGLTLLSGHGFSIPVKLLGVTNIRSRLDSTLTAAGINQTLHRIDLVVEADLVLLLPGGPCTHSISTRLPLTETVLLGQVPDNYPYFSQFDSAREAAAAYFDYGAGQH